MQALIVGREITGLSAISGRKPEALSIAGSGGQRAGVSVLVTAVIRRHSGQAVRPAPDALPLLRAPHLHDRAADGELDLAVELGRRPVRLDGVPRMRVCARAVPDHRSGRANPTA